MSQEQYKKRLKALMSKPENQICSDCPERQPRWASLIVPPVGSPPGAIPIGAFCCLECSGSHRRLGVHISFVRSVNLDSWKEKEVLAMENGGNKKVNAIFEANLNVAKPAALADGRTRERYIRDKYERRKFYNPAVLQKYYAGDHCDEDDDEEEDEEEEIPRVKKATTIRSPSEAAVKRAETRRARLTSTRSSVDHVRKDTINPKIKVEKKKAKNVTTSVKPSQASSPKNPPVVVDLLDFGSSPMDNPGPPPDPPSLVASPTPSPNLDLFSTVFNDVTKNKGNNNCVSDTAAKTAVETQGQNQSEINQAGQPKKFNNAEIMSLFNQPQPTGLGMGNGVLSSNGNMNIMNMNQTIMSNMMGMMQNQNVSGHMNSMQSNIPMQKQQGTQNQQMNMMMMQNGGNMGMFQPQLQQPNQYNINSFSNQINSNNNGIGGMQQHLTMMNNLQINNVGMMMQSGGQQQTVQGNQGHNDQKNQNLGIMGGIGPSQGSRMHGFGM